jgi:hypothetical protein
MANTKNSVRDLALFYATRGEDGAVAVQHAATGILGRYDFSGTMRVPKGMLGAVETATDNLLANLKPTDLMPLAADTQATRAGPGMTTEQRQNVTLQAARRGKWVTNEDDTGLVLVGQDASGRQVVMRRANGGRIELPFASLDEGVKGALANPAARPPMMVPGL